MDPNRRQFLKLSTLGGVTASVLGFDLTPAYAQVRELKIARTTETRSTCPYCSVSCGVIIHTLGDRSRNVRPAVVHVEGDPDHPINQGTLCPKGITLKQNIVNDRRLTTVKYRAPGSRAWEDKPWDWAIDRIAQLVKQTRDTRLRIEDARGRTINALTAIGVIGGCTDTNEVNYLLVKAFRAGLGVIPIEQQVGTVMHIDNVLVRDVFGTLILVPPSLDAHGRRSMFSIGGPLARNRSHFFGAYEGTRLLGAFNKTVDNFIDFVTYTCFIDRDGKYQLTMLRHSSFDPLSRSVGPMLKEEAFHLFTGQSGLSRIVKAGKVPIEIVQKYLNKWLSTGYDLFGKDRSGSAARFYRWGFKGRFDEATAKEPPKDLERLNEEARLLYYKEDCEIIDSLNKLLPAGGPKLRAPDVKFNREIGDYAGKRYSVTGEPLAEAEFAEHLKEVLPGPEDMKILVPIFKSGRWMIADAAAA